MKRLQREFEFSPEQQNTVALLAEELSITRTTAKILYSRGMDTAEKMRGFLSPSRKRFLSPYLMSGMKEAVSLLTRAREEGWRVAVFGDYDADGIGACAILSRALKSFGIEPYVFVPERADGYGMSVKAIDKIFDEFLPDLIVTVDCGISNRKEVEYIKEQGAYVIVTDHHELPEELPDCILVNPKLKDDYPYDNLCGAGVAFKLASALIGEKALPLLDFAALSTVADSVPLTNENRDIVAEGLRLIEREPRPAFAALLGKTAEVTSQTLAFTVAPRINAAGRMGDARAALRLFTTDDPEEISLLAEKLHLYNAERQRACDEVYAQAAKQAREEGAYGNVVMLTGESWNTGFVGIVAARIAEEFCRPALLFVRRDGMLRGSVRSIENVNIYEALKACSEYIEEFGGHSQAAGVNVREENFEKLRSALDRYIGEHYSQADFLPSITVVGEGDGGIRLARELARLEPFGVGNPRPLFTAEAESLSAAPIKPLSPHLSFSAEGLDFMYFGGAKDRKLLRSGLSKTLVYEYNLSRFRGREYLKGFVRAVLYDGAGGGDRLRAEAFDNALHALRQPEAAGEQMPASELDLFIAQARQRCRYGLCAVVSDCATLALYPSAAGLPVEAFRLSSGDTGNAVLFAPDPQTDLSAFREVVFLDRPPALSYKTGSARVLVGDICGFGAFLKLDLSRETLLGIFSAIRAAEPILGEADDLTDLARECGALGFPEEEFLFALAVFAELGIVSFQGGALRTVRGRRTELTDSELYRRTLRLQEEEP